MFQSRRKFIVGSALTAGAAVIIPGTAPAAVCPSPAPEDTGAVQLGLASYTFREFSRAQMIAFLKQLRITELNAKDVEDHLPSDPAGEAAAVQEYTANGIRLHAVGAVYFSKDEDEDVRSKFEYARRAGVSVIVAGDPTPESLPRIERFAKQYDIRVAIHNHGPEDKIWKSPMDVLRAVQRMDARLGCCIDIGHCVRAGTDVVEAIHAAGPRLFNVHAKDLTDFHSKESQVAVGDGRMPMRDIFRALIATKYRGYVDLEYEVHAEDPMPGVLSSFAYMRGVLAGMA